MNWVLICFLWCFSIIGCAEEAIIMNVNLTQAQFEVNLPANPTTGYQWRVESYDKQLLNLTKSEYQPSQPQMIGSGGHMLYIFELIKGKNRPKNTNLVFKYSRPWEKNGDSNVQKVRVEFGE